MMQKLSRVHDVFEELSIKFCTGTISLHSDAENPKIMTAIEAAVEAFIVLFCIILFCVILVVMCKSVVKWSCDPDPEDPDVTR